MLLDPADAAVAAWAIRDAIRALRVAGRPVPGRLTALAGTLTAAAVATANGVRPDWATRAASTADLTADEGVTVSEAGPRSPAPSLPPLSLPPTAFALTGLRGQHPRQT
ncbi:hypothetical protein JNW91_16780 [Micromonospora sp. STR1_7]|uniref:Uncharacterized protein n=1 Tax=Micromonospora parastrephiae TaxID=2806101 RepID=A0ABS1XW46_9ACTN|nr:hypothetical protein [Micromonospora parastrephiae]